MNEFAPEKSHAWMGSYYQISEGSIYIFLTIYYKFISRDVSYPLMFGTVLNVVILFALIGIPESPKWLYSKKRYEECHDVIRYMAKVNRVDSIEKPQFELTRK